MSLKGAIKGAKTLAATEPDNPIKGFQGLIGLAITFLSGLCFPVLGCLRHKFGERFYLVPERLMWGLIVQFLFFWILKGIGFIWGIFYVEGLYKFFVFLDLVMLFHIGRIFLEMVWEKPQHSYSTGSPIFWPLWNIFKRAPWISDSTVKLILEPLSVFIISLFVLRYGNSAIGSYLFMSSFALLQLESTIFRHRRNFYLDHKDSERIELGQASRVHRLPKPVPIIHQ